MANNMFAIKKQYLDPLWKKFKAKYKDALDTDQDAYYAAATMAYAEYLNAIENANKSEESFSNLTNQLQNKSKDQLAFTTAWYNDFLIELKKQRALQENNFLTAQTEALNGNSPTSLTEQLRNFLQPIDDMIGEYEAEFVNFLHENDLERNQLGLEDIDYISQSGYDDIQNAGLNNIFNNGEYTADDILNHHMQKMLYIGSIINKKAFSDRWQDITHESADQMKQRLDAYKKAKNDKFKQAQTDGKSQSEQAAVAQEQSSIRNWLKTATVEEIDTKYEETKAQLDEQIQEFDRFVESIDPTTQLGADLNKALNKANALAEAANNSTATKVRALSLYVDQFLKQYQGAENEQAK